MAQSRGRGNTGRRRRCHWRSVARAFAQGGLRSASAGGRRRKSRAVDELKGRRPRGPRVSVDARQEAEVESSSPTSRRTSGPIESVFQCGIERQQPLLDTPRSCSSRAGNCCYGGFLVRSRGDALHAAARPAAPSSLPAPPPAPRGQGFRAFHPRNSDFGGGPGRWRANSAHNIHVVICDRRRRGREAIHQRMKGQRHRGQPQSPAQPEKRRPSPKPIGSRISKPATAGPMNSISAHP